MSGSWVEGFSGLLEKNSLRMKLFNLFDIKIKHDGGIRASEAVGRGMNVKAPDRTGAFTEKRDGSAHHGHVTVDLMPFLGYAFAHAGMEGEHATWHQSAVHGAIPAI